MAISLTSITNFFRDEIKLIERAENALRSNRLIKFTYDGTHGAINASVQPSMKKGAYVVTVFIDDERNIDASNAPHCTCERGQFRCHHMAVAMLHAYKNLSCTDKMCTWSRPKASAGEVRTVVTMYPETNTTSCVKRPVDEDDRQSLFASLQTANKQCALTWLLSPEPVYDTCSVPTVSNLVLSQNLSADCSSDELCAFMHSLQVSRDDIVSVERGTQNQQHNPMWGEYRSGRLTASNFGAVIKCIEAGRAPSASLLKTLLGEYDASGAKAVQWGIHHEKSAIKKYEQERGTTVQASGLWLHPNGFCGASPDGIVDDDTLIEVKCPFAARNDNLFDKISDSFFLHYNADGAVALNERNPQGHAYYHQVQGNLWLACRNACDFVVWNPNSLLIISVKRDTEYQQKYLAAMQQFYTQYFVRHFIGRYHGKEPAGC